MRHYTSRERAAWRPNRPEIQEWAYERKPLGYWQLLRRHHMFGPTRTKPKRTWKRDTTRAWQFRDFVRELEGRLAMEAAA